MAGPVSLDALRIQRVHGIVYGLAGVGKTIFLTGSQTMRTLFIDVDDGALSAARWPGTNKKIVVHYAVRTYGEFMGAMAYLRANISSFDLVVIDTATELQAIVMQEIAEKNKLQFLDQRAWGLVLNQMIAVFEFLRHLPISVMVGAHELHDTDEASKRMSYRPAFKGALAVDYARKFDLICRYVVYDQSTSDPATKTVTTTTHRLLQCHKDSSTEAKDRSNALAKYEHPSIDPLFAKMLGVSGE